MTTSSCRSARSSGHTGTSLARRWRVRHSRSFVTGDATPPRTVNGITTRTVNGPKSGRRTCGWCQSTRRKRGYPRNARFSRRLSPWRTCLPTHPPARLTPSRGPHRRGFPPTADVGGMHPRIRGRQPRNPAEPMVSGTKRHVLRVGVPVRQAPVGCRTELARFTSTLEGGILSLSQDNARSADVSAATVPDFGRDRASECSTPAPFGHTGASAGGDRTTSLEGPLTGGRACASTKQLPVRQSV